jgi:hypothetical protein
MAGSPTQPKAQNIVQKIHPESQKNQLIAIHTLLVECEMGFLGLAQLLECGTEHHVSTDMLFHLLRPLLSQQQAAVNHLSELV